ncbi:MAG: type II secretion system GspH family protein [Bacteriovoracaceae bacterium]|nr:type II secretion system GspH family protein [Bacteriovoracaceae bacterium]
MKTFTKSLKRQDGFTLVELMVVVAIIGLLSAVAIPNFRKYQAKAKMSEAKLQLSSVYTAETAFFSDYNIYHNCLAYMGYNPQREVANRYYAIGFGVASNINDVAYAAAVNSGLSNVATDCPDTNAVTSMTSLVPTDPVANNTTFFTAGKGVGSARATSTTFLPTTVIADQSSQANMSFTAGAAGVIDGDNTATTTASQLTIDQLKNFRVVRNGY